MPGRILEGTVVSNKMDKSVVVRVERYERHPIYKKFVKLHKKYHAHDEKNICQEGDSVRIAETAPISKKKSWTVLDDKLGKA